VPSFVYYDDFSGFVKTEEGDAYGMSEGAKRDPQVRVSNFLILKGERR
jgi:hypothetical protein